MNSRSQVSVEPKKQKARWCRPSGDAAARLSRLCLYCRLLGGERGIIQNSLRAALTLRASSLRASFKKLLWSRFVEPEGVNQVLTLRHKQKRATLAGSPFSFMAESEGFEP